MEGHTALNSQSINKWSKPWWARPGGDLIHKLHYGNNTKHGPPGLCGPGGYFGCSRAAAHPWVDPRGGDSLYQVITSFEGWKQRTFRIPCRGFYSVRAIQLKLDLRGFSKRRAWPSVALCKSINQTYKKIQNILSCVQIHHIRLLSALNYRPERYHPFTSICGDDCTPYPLHNDRF